MPVGVDDLFGLGCAYEAYVLAAGRFPPITRICRRHRGWAIPVVAVFLAHLLLQQKEAL